MAECFDRSEHENTSGRHGRLCDVARAPGYGAPYPGAGGLREGDEEVDVGDDRARGDGCQRGDELGVEDHAGFASGVERVGLGLRTVVDVGAQVVFDRQSNAASATGLDAVVLAAGACVAVGTGELNGGGIACGETTNRAVLDTQCKLASAHFSVDSTAEIEGGNVAQTDRAGDAGTRINWLDRASVGIDGTGEVDLPDAVGERAGAYQAGGQTQGQCEERLLHVSNPFIAGRRNEIETTPASHAF